jgi:hypothetical protein
MRAASSNALAGIFGMRDRTEDAGHDPRLFMYGNALIHRSRNNALAGVRADADYVLMVDDDMLPEPEALLKVLAHGVPVVSAACTTKVPPIHYAAKVFDPAADQFVPFDAIRPDTLVTGPFAVGGAFLLIDRKTIDALIEYHLSARDWLEENRRLLDRLHVRTEFRERERARKEEIRRARWASERLMRVFDFPVTDGELQLGEDISLGRRLLNLGIPVSIDSGVAVGHLGEYTYGPWNVEEEKDVNEPDRTVC